MRVKSVLSILVILAFILPVSGSNPTSEKKESTDSNVTQQEVEVVYDASAVEGMTRGSTLVGHVNTSQNFGGKEKFKRKCLKQIKEEALKKGYSKVLIDEEKSKVKRFNKRGIDVKVVAYGYQ